MLGKICFVQNPHADDKQVVSLAELANERKIFLKNYKISRFIILGLHAYTGAPYNAVIPNHFVSEMF